MSDCPYCGDPRRPKQQTCGAEICEEVLADELHAAEVKGREPTPFMARLAERIEETIQ